MTLSRLLRRGARDELLAERPEERPDQDPLEISVMVVASNSGASDILSLF